MTTVGDTIIFVFLCVLGLCITLTNVFVLYLVFKRRSLRNPTNLCLSSLAASDLMAGTISIPLVITCSLTRDYDGICLAMDMSSRFISNSTALHLLVVTIERYIMIVHGLKYNSWVTTSRVVMMLVGTWVWSAVVTLLQLSWKLTLPNESTKKPDAIYDFTCFVSIVIIPLIIMTASYIRIFIALRYQLKVIQRYNNPVEKNAELRKRHVERKAAIIFISMILMYICCWFSYFLDGIRDDLESDVLNYPMQVAHFFMFLRFVSPLVNPLLYTFLKQDFKIAMKMTLCQRFRGDRNTLYVYQTQYVPSNSQSAVSREMAPLNTNTPP